jgi:hypothetical protein
LRKATADKLAAWRPAPLGSGTSYRGPP